MRKISRKINLKAGYMQIYTDPQIKEKFVNLVQEENLSISEAIERLILEAISRGYIDKERRELLMKIKS